MYRSVAKNFSILTTATLIEAALTFLFLAFVARQFGPTLFGKYILVNVSVHIASVIVNAGVVPIAIRELARDRENSKDLFNDILSLRLVLGVTAYFTLLLVTVWSTDNRLYYTLIGVAGMKLLIEPFSESYRAYYTAHERMITPSVFSVASAGLSALAGGILLISGYGLYALILSGIAVALLVAIFWTVRFRRNEVKFRFRIQFAVWRRLLILIIPFAPIHISSQINRVLNVFLLGRINGPLPMVQSVGYYSPANSVTNTIVKLVMSLRRALIPAVTVRLSQGHSVTREIDVAMKVVIAMFCLPLILGTSFMSPEIILLLFGDQYAPSATVLLILGWAGALQIAAFVPESFLFSHPDHKMQDYIFGPIVSILVNIALCVLLIPSYGIVGAAAAAVTARLVYFMFVAHYYRRQAPGQSLNLLKYWDVTLLAVLSFGVSHFTFNWIENIWFAFTAAGLTTLFLIGVFLLHLGSQLRTQTA